MNIANRLTILRFLLVPIFVILRMIPQSWAVLAAGIVFILASLTDMLDGHLARSRHLVTEFGKFADPLADKVLSSAAMIMLVASGQIPAWAVIVIIAREFAITGFRILAAAQQITIAAGPLGKIKTVMQLVSMTWLLFVPGLPPMPGLVAFYISVVLTVISGADYLWRNRQVLDLENL